MEWKIERSGEIFSNRESEFEKFKKDVNDFFEDDVKVVIFNCHAHSDFSDVRSSYRDEYEEAVKKAPKDSKTLYLVSWGYDGRQESCKDYSGVFDSIIKPAAIKDTEYLVTYSGIPLAVYNFTDNILFYLFDASHPNNNSKIIAKWVIQELADKFNNNGIFTNTKSEKRIAITGNKIIPANVITPVVEKRKEEYMSEKSEVESSIRDYVRTICEYKKNIIHLNETIIALEDYKASEVKIDNPLVTGIVRNKEELKIYLKPTFVSSGDGKYKYIDTFYIFININNGATSVCRENNSIFVMFFGKYSETISTCIAKFDFNTAINLMIKCLIETIIEDKTAPFSRDYDGYELVDGVYKKGGIPFVEPPKKKFSMPF